LGYDWERYCREQNGFEGRTPETKNTPSKEFERNFVGVKCVRMLPRFYEAKNVEFVNEHLKHFCEKYYQSIHIPTNVWRMVDLSIEKSYEETARFFEQKPTKINQNDFDLAFALAVKHVFPYFRECGELTAEECIEKVDNNTSPGYYFNRKFPTFGDLKKDYNVLRDVAEYAKSLDGDSPLPDVYLNSLKRELRKKGKAPRTFMAGPKRTQILKMKYFYQQNQSMVKNHRHMWPKVGMSEMHGGFEELYYKLKNKAGTVDPWFWDSDATKWDGSVPPQLLDAVLYLRLACMPESVRKDRVKMKRIWRLHLASLYGFILMENGEVVQKPRGVASGDANTIFDNSLAHLMVAYYALVRMLPKEWRVKETDEIYVLIHSAVEMAFMGDDNLGAVDREKFPWFSETVMEEAYNDFGILLKRVSAGKNLFDREFLSAKFTFVNFDGSSRICALHDREKMLCQLYYGNSDTHPKVLLERSLAIEKVAWPDPVLRDLLRTFNEWFFRVFDKTLRAEMEDMPSFSALQAQRMTPQEIGFIHCGAGLKETAQESVISGVVYST